MSKNDLFDALWKIVKDTNVDYYEVIVGDEEPDEMYVKFKGIEENTRPQCSECGYEWSACLGDDEMPTKCECGGEVTLP